MKKFLTSKIFIILVVLIGLVVFNTLVFNVSIVKRNIVIGIGLDYKDGEYVLLTQVALPKNGGVTNGGNNYITVKDQAQTVEIAIDKIEKAQGAVLSFAQAAILILGKDLITSGKLDAVDKFFTKLRVHDNLLIVMAEDKAEDILNASVAVGEVSSLQLISQLRLTKVPLEASPISLQEYIRNSVNANKINYMPIVSVEKTQPSTDQTKNDDEQADKLHITKTAIIENKQLMLMFDEEQTKSYCLVKPKLQDGVLKVDGENSFSVQIVDSKAKFEFDIEKQKCTIKIKMKTIRTEPRMVEGNNSFKMSEKEMESLKKAVDERVQNLYQFCLAKDVDIFNLRYGFLKKFPKKSSQIMSSSFLANTNVATELDITQVV